MRESQMKKIIAAAVASAFVAPAFAADVTISGGADFYYKDANSQTSTGYDSNAVSIKASSETANGIGVSMDVNINTLVSDDGGGSITLSGPFGSIDMGDTSSATDAFDDATDKDVVVGGVGGGGSNDAAILWTLPSTVDGLTVVVSHSADSNGAAAGQVDAANGYGFKYSLEGVTVAYAILDAQTNTSDQTYAGVTTSFGGVGLAVEQWQTGASGAETKVQGIGLTYAMGDTSLALSNAKEKSAAGATTDDNTVVTVKHSLGGGLTVFAETRSNSKDASDDANAVGVVYAF
jgi:outer membrane protein OmpU